MLWLALKWLLAKHSAMSPVTVHVGHGSLSPKVHLPPSLAGGLLRLPTLCQGSPCRWGRSMDGAWTVSPCMDGAWPCMLHGHFAISALLPACLSPPQQRPD